MIVWEDMAGAVDREIFQDADLAQLTPKSEIYAMSKIGGY
jgi:hypothetical protein